MSYFPNREYRVKTDDGSAYEVSVTMSGVVVRESGEYNIEDYGAVGGGTVNDTIAIQLAIDTCYSDGGGTVIMPPKDYKTTSTLIGRMGVTLHCNYGSNIISAHTGYSLQVVEGFSVTGRLSIEHTVASASGSLLMKPVSADYFTGTKRTTIEDAYLFGYVDGTATYSPHGTGIMFDMTDFSGSFVEFGNVVIRSFDTAIDFIVPTSADYITSVTFNCFTDLYCANTINESGSAGTISNFTFGNIIVQPSKIREYGIKGDNLDYFVFSDAIFWDWDTASKVDLTLIGEKVYFGSSSKYNLVITPSSQMNNMYDVGKGNRIEVLHPKGSTLQAVGSVGIPSSTATPFFLGNQDDFLIRADRLHTVTNSTLAGATTIDDAFNLYTDYAEFTNNGTDYQEINIDLGAAYDVYNFGVMFDTGYVPTTVKLSVYANAAWRELYSSTSADLHHSVDLKAYRTTAEQLKVSFVLAGGGAIRVNRVWAFSPEKYGKAFVDCDGRNSIQRTLYFDASAIGEGIRMISPDASPFTVTVSDDGDVVTNSPTVYKSVGAGTPEGSVTAPLGSTYQNTSGGAGTSFYVKETETVPGTPDNTGWVGK